MRDKEFWGMNRPVSCSYHSSFLGIWHFGRSTRWRIQRRKQSEVDGKAQWWRKTFPTTSQVQKWNWMATWHGHSCRLIVSGFPPLLLVNWKINRIETSAQLPSGNIIYSPLPHFHPFTLTIRRRWKLEIKMSLQLSENQINKTHRHLLMPIYNFSTNYTAHIPDTAVIWLDNLLTDGGYLIILAKMIVSSPQVSIYPKCQ